MAFKKRQNPTFKDSSPSSTHTETKDESSHRDMNKNAYVKQECVSFRKCTFRNVLILFISTTVNNNNTNNNNNNVTTNNHNDNNIACSISFGIKPKRIFNEVSQEIEFIYLEYKAIESQITRNINKQLSPDVIKFDEIPDESK
ncbi:hypothetical protein H8356DRAFT_1361573 [Neocallimastix lanati (nom. inval.)]|nr:hypothetical protein H8356DRAFT_1361573 [Neocallimastix sp. JGI-2020a]